MEPAAEENHSHFLTNALLCTVASLIVYLLYLSWSRPNKFPPGPYGWPLVGSLPSLSRDKPYKVLTKLSKQYDDVFSIKIGQRLAVVLNGQNALREALVRKADYFSGRPTFTPGAIVSEGKGIINAQHDENGRHLRRFTLKTLKHFGMGKSVLEGSILKEVRHMTDAINIHSGMPIDLSIHLSNATYNIICSMVFGKRYRYNDQRFQRLLTMVADFFKLSGIAAMTKYLPILRLIPWNNILEKIHWRTNEIKQWIQPDIDEHIEHFDLSSEPKDFVDVYLAEMTRDELKEQPTSMNSTNLVRTIIDLFLAGTETTATTLRWAILYLVLHPDIQKKVRDEIIDEVGQDRDVSMADKHKLPYTEAVILEVNRISCIAPLAVFHTTTDDVTVGGYLIPKHTMVIPNLWSAHMDPEVWVEPDAFMPERFLHNGKVVNSDKIVSFSLGRRACVGRQLAEMELFLILTTLLQHHEFSIPEGMEPPTTERIVGITVFPKPYEVCVVKH
ncbi:cytochrome P450 2U1-like [Saccoglossus kowalevskii]|uniref:Cytochrome P450 2U1-like n=1 Tax=Saccoglossus kowalevskii TaxID=10224 RepID=A0ABM0MP35_SACKO|nr:PREDICTED: cytochrome P450 2U1-like [Saccoglossus kowalevskii]